MLHIQGHLKPISSGRRVRGSETEVTCTKFCLVLVSINDTYLKIRLHRIVAVAIHVLQLITCWQSMRQVNMDGSVQIIRSNWPTNHMKRRCATHIFSTHLACCSIPIQQGSLNISVRGSHSIFCTFCGLKKEQIYE